MIGGDEDFVLDCSIAAAWLFDDEVTAQTNDLLEQLKDDHAFEAVKVFS